MAPIKIEWRKLRIFNRLNTLEWEVALLKGRVAELEGMRQTSERIAARGANSVKDAGDAEKAKAEAEEIQKLTAEWLLFEDERPVKEELKA